MGARAGVAAHSSTYMACREDLVVTMFGCEYAFGLQDAVVGARGAMKKKGGWIWQMLRQVVTQQPLPRRVIVRIGSACSAEHLSLNGALFLWRDPVPTALRAWMFT